MTDRDALLAAIRANPDDDLPRLVYADWLDEYGHTLPPPERDSAADRAAFIRAQIEAARAEPFSPAARAAREQTDQLLTPARQEQWTWHLREFVKEAGFVRGFPEFAHVEAARFPQVADALFDAEPIRVLWLPREPRSGDFADELVSLEPVFAVPQLQQVIGLNLWSAEMTSSLEYDALAESPHLTELRSLVLSGNPVPPSWLTNFLAGDRLPNLTRLDLADIPNLGPAVANGLSRAPHRRLTELNLSGVASLRGDDLHRVLVSRCLREVESLSLGWDGPHAGPLTRLNIGWVIPWGRLRQLDVTGQGIGAEGAREIARNRDAAALRWLGLAGNHLGSDGARQLAESPYLKLYHLDVSRNGLWPRDVDALRQRFPEAVIVE